MKRSLNILMALMLSLMVVYLSVGTTVMHCLRYDKVMVGMVADGCVKRCMDHDCCQGKLGAQVNKHCMEVELVKYRLRSLSNTWISMQHQCLLASCQLFGRRCLVLLSVAFKRQDIGIRMFCIHLQGLILPSLTS